ncbi:MAG: hypothetical protein SAL07_14130 [Oscillatoria sp. PMC 1051.18]|nr:hypothetical protein [Oscillatoria sp. PMC 1050.18]MEC5031031.1 hypothetical protein [Oscillatoria sp. PMC 1051.18]
MLGLVVSLALAIVGIYVSLNVTDEIESILAIVIAVICLFLSLVFLPLPLKGAIAIILLISAKSSLSIFSKS